MSTWEFQCFCSICLLLPIFFFCLLSSPSLILRSQPNWLLLITMLTRSRPVSANNHLLAVVFGSTWKLTQTSSNQASCRLVGMPQRRKHHLLTNFIRIIQLLVATDELTFVLSDIKWHKRQVFLLISLALFECSSLLSNYKNYQTEVTYTWPNW